LPRRDEIREDAAVTRRTALVRAADAIAGALAALAFVIDLIGGFQVGRGWYRLSMRDPARLLIAAIVLVLIRHALQPRPSWRTRLQQLTDRRAFVNLRDRRLVRPSRAQWLVACLVLIGGTMALLHQQLFNLAGVPDRGDPLFSMWRLGWIAHQLRSAPLRLFDANIFFPSSDTLAYSDATLLPGVLTAPMIWAGVPLATAHGLLYLAAFAGAGLTMFALAFALTGRPAASLAAGLMFGCCPYRISTYSHLEMQGIALMPLCVLALLRVVQDGRARDGLWLGAAIAAQSLWSLYLGAYLAVGLAAMLAGLWGCGTFVLRRRLAPFACAILASAAVLLPYSRPYWRAQQTVGSRAPAELQRFTAEPADFTMVTTNSATYGRRLTTAQTGERALFPGFAPLGLAAIAIAPPAGPVAVAAGLTALVAADATRGLDGLTFRALYTVAPPFRAFRVPARFAMIIDFCLCLLSAAALARLESWSAGRLAARAAFGLLILLAIAENRPRLDLITAPRAPAIYQALAADPGAPIADLPIPEDDFEFLAEPTYVYYSTSHWHPLLNGYSGFSPSWYGRLQHASTEMPSSEAIETLRAAGARYVVVHEAYYPPDHYRRIVEGLDSRPDVARIAVESSAEGERRLYRLATR